MPIVPAISPGLPRLVAKCDECSWSERGETYTALTPALTSHRQKHEVEKEAARSFVVPSVRRPLGRA